MLREAMGPKFKGHAMEFSLSKWGYGNYTAECTYHFDEKEGKYSLSMWISRDDVGDRMKISSKEVDTQYIPGTEGTVVENICRIVHQAATAAGENGKRYLDRFVERYEYELRCFERGNDLFEAERLARTHDGKS